MSQLLGSPLLVDFILAVLALETALLWLWHQRTGHGIAPRQLLPNALAGACLLLALRASLADSGAAYIGLALCGALGAHLADLWLRWRPRAGGRRD